MESANEPRRAPWRMRTLGSTVWAPFGEDGWRPGIITSLGKNRGNNTVVHLSFETGGKRLSWKSSLLQVGNRVAHRVHRPWERVKYPAGGLVDNAPALRSSVCRAWLTPPGIVLDDRIKDQQQLAHGRNQRDFVRFAPGT